MKANTVTYAITPAFTSYLMLTEVVGRIIEACN